MTIRPWHILILTGAALLTTSILFACKKEPQAIDEPRETPSEPAEEPNLLPAGAEGFSESMLIDDHTVHLETFLWRDFMPGPETPADGRALTGVLRLVAEDQAHINGLVHINYVWLVYEDEVWGVALPAPAPLDPVYQVEQSFTGGPRWPTSAVVDVIVRVEGQYDLIDYLRINSQPIHRTQ
ncbi:hypothetical protein GF420_08810 [candidate division GN15 bacterium]|nr:hypothetical protein [candidate division GN15 bacterium]